MNFSKETKETLSHIVIATVAVSLFLYLSQFESKHPGLTFTFVNQETKQELTVFFDQETNVATIKSGEYMNIELEPAVSASGARYVNEKQDIELFNKGRDLMFRKGDTVIFFGTALERKRATVPRF